MSVDDAECILIDIEKAHLTKNARVLGMGKMDPFVKLSKKERKDESEAELITRTATQWDAHMEPVWYHVCPRIPTKDKGSAVLSFVVLNDSQFKLHRPKLIGSHDISIEDLIQQARSSKQGSLGLPSLVKLPLCDKTGARTGALVLQVRVKDYESVRKAQLECQNNKNTSRVDPSWFESPVTRLGVSGGTAPFFNLVLTDAGLQHCAEQPSMSSRNQHDVISKSYFIGKDLSHAEDEREFYEQILQIKSTGAEADGVALLAPFMFEYLGVLETTTTEEPSTTCRLLVMQNLRNDYHHFRMLDLKMGHQTAQGGWQGKSRAAALRQYLLDGITNSRTEGYRLEGFDGCPQRVDSMDPWIDFLAKQTTSENSTAFDDNKSGTSTYSIVRKTIWGSQVTDKDVKKAKRIMMQQMTGSEIFRYFLDVHLDSAGSETGSAPNHENFLISTEVAEIVLHEIVGKLARLAVTCHKVKVPQKWIGSSVALAYDAGLYPPRSESDEAERVIRSKVVVNVFDWGRSEVLMQRGYEALTPAEKTDREQFWNNYKNGIRQLAYNAARSYYHQFTNVDPWMELTLQVMDFDSLTADDYMGQATIPLPDPSDETALHTLQTSTAYKLAGRWAACGVVYCSLVWVDFSADSRLKGAWRVTVERATGLPAMDVNSLSDPYCAVVARDGRNGSHSRELKQMTCVKARTLNPVWNETFDVPIVRTSALAETLVAEGISKEPALTGIKMAELFKSRNSGDWQKMVCDAAS